MDSYFVYLFHASTLFLLVAFVSALVLKSRGQAVLGRVLSRTRPPLGARLAGWLALALLAALVLVSGHKWLILSAFPALSMALLLQTVRPGFRDLTCGEAGVQVGWRYAGLDELAEWRLSGEHLRLRFEPQGEWSAVELPPAEHAAMRARLELRAPGRESRFTDRQQPIAHLERRPEIMPSKAPLPKADVADGGID